MRTRHEALTSLLALPLLFALGATARRPASIPQAPQSLPNGSKATKEEMLAAQGEVKAVLEGRAGGLPSVPRAGKDRAVAALDNMDPDYTQKKAAIEAMHAKKHNAALDELTAMADRWGQELQGLQRRAEEVGAVTGRPVQPLPTPAEAEALIRQHVRRCRSSRARSPALAGAVLAQSVRAERDQPPFDRVTMDGIAIASEAWRAGQRRFRIAGTQAAGQRPQHAAARSAASR